MRQIQNVRRLRAHRLISVFTLITGLVLFKTLCYVYTLLPDYINLIQFMFQRTSTT